MNLNSIVQTNEIGLGGQWITRKGRITSAPYFINEQEVVWVEWFGSKTDGEHPTRKLYYA